jgi:hypothetical protein
MNHQMTSALVKDRQRELTREASRYAARRASDHTGRRIPRYHVSWSRMSLPAIGAAGRRERSWVIVISATKGV